MERKLQERMVGAGVLILALVIIGPMVLDGGPDDSPDEADVPGQRPDEIRTHTFRLNEPPPPAAESPQARTATPAGEPDRAGPEPERPPEPAPAARPSLPPPEPAAETAPRRDTAAAPAAPIVAAAAPKAAAAAGGFLVQVGTFGQKDNAERLAGTLKGKGFAAFVSPTSRAGKTLYRVRVGPAGSRDTAAGLAARLAAAGQSGQVVAQ